MKQRRKHQQYIFGLYQDFLKNNSRVRLAPFDPAGGALPLWVDAEVEGRDELCEYLEKRGIQPRKFWKPVHMHAAYYQNSDSFPVSTRIAATALWFPSGLQLTDENVSEVCRAINEWAKIPTRAVSIS